MKAALRKRYKLTRKQSIQAWTLAVFLSVIMTMSSFVDRGPWFLQLISLGYTYVSLWALSRSYFLRDSATSTL